jgi:hypothetical protein
MKKINIALIMLIGTLALVLILLLNRKSEGNRYFDFNSDGFGDAIIFDYIQPAIATVNINISIYNQTDGLYHTLKNDELHVISLPSARIQEIDLGWIFVDKINNYVIYDFKKDTAVLVESGKLEFDRDLSNLQKLR